MAGCGDGDRKKTTNDDQVIAPPARWFCLLTLSVLHLSASVHRALSLSLLGVEIRMNARHVAATLLSASTHMWPSRGRVLPPPCSPCLARNIIKLEQKGGVFPNAPS
jgi:hypothetical protein